MTVLFLSNHFNHHQKPFSDAMFRLLGENYHFVETEPMSAERRSLGWGGIAYPSYIIRPEEAFTPETQAMIDSADVVIIGSAPNSLVKNRIRKNKLVFRYAERPFKKKPTPWRYLPRLVLWNLRNPFWKPVYMLCASAYTASDYAKMGLFLGKCYKWGYFPETKRYEDVDQLIAAKRPNSILWVARFIDWKHPEIPLEIARRLKQEGYDFTLNMIGNGELLEATQEQINALGLSDCVKLLGAMSPEDVRAHMEQSEVFLFTSDRNEGWGAVLNESMNSACAVVANRAIGSVPFLIVDGVNGDIYEDGNIDDLYQKVKAILDHPARRIEKSKNAYATITKEWNAETAAERFVTLAGSMLNGGKKALFETGVCSKANER